MKGHRTLLSRSTYCFSRQWAGGFFVHNRSFSVNQATELVDIPSLPIIGSMVSHHSNIPKFEQTKMHRVWREMRGKFGGFYKMGLPFAPFAGFWDPQVYIIQDPVEFSKVIRSEGVYPGSSVDSLWMAKHGSPQVAGPVANLIGSGPEWKRYRTFAQTDLLAPQSANRYIPGVIEAVEYATKGIDKRHDDMWIYLNECTLDMACTVLFGKMLRVSDPSFQSDPIAEELCRAASIAMSLPPMSRYDFISKMLVTQLGINVPKYALFTENLRKTIKIGEQWVKEVVEKRKEGTLSELEASSYANNAISRQLEQDDVSRPIPLSEVGTMVAMLMGAAVDTTASLISWNLLHLALNSDKQELCRQEILQAVSTTGGRLTPDIMNSKDLPYLFALIRESHRLTNPAPLLPLKVLPKEVEIHGTVIPEGSVVLFEGYSQGFDPAIIGDGDPEAFEPERFLPEAVAARKGKLAERLDHTLVSAPFSAGARRCPGSRIAANEVTVYLAQLLLDWELETHEVKHWTEVNAIQRALLTPELPRIEFKARH